MNGSPFEILRTISRDFTCLKKNNFHQSNFCFAGGVSSLSSSLCHSGSLASLVLLFYFHLLIWRFSIEMCPTWGCVSLTLTQFIFQQESVVSEKQQFEIWAYIWNSDFNMVIGYGINLGYLWKGLTIGLEICRAGRPRGFWGHLVELLFI